MEYYKCEQYADGQMNFLPFDLDEDYLKKWVEEFKAEMGGNTAHEAQAFYDWVIAQPPSKVFAVLS